MTPLEKVLEVQRRNIDEWLLNVANELGDADEIGPVHMMILEVNSSLGHNFRFVWRRDEQE